MNFGSDNTTGIAPPILDAIIAANAGDAAAYGGDDLTGGLTERFRELFDHDVTVFPVLTGTAANALALAALTPPYGVVYCHENAHVEEDECGAPEFYTGGAKLMALPGPDGRLNPEGLEAGIGRFIKGFEHHTQPATLSLSQSTEWGTVYGVDEIQALTASARNHGLMVHMDGARFANAVASLDCKPADITWKAGVDVLSFGATKNGAMMAEAVVFFDPALAGDFVYRRKRGGHLISKMRYVSAQLEAYLANDLWLTNARHANRMAGRLAAGLADVPGARIVTPVQANEVFVQLLAEVADGLLGAGFSFHPWPAAGSNFYRLVTAFDTAEANVDSLIDTAHRLAGETARRTA